MTKKRRAPIRIGDAEEDESTDVDDGRPRPAPNTNFLGRLVLGVATGNQRQIDTTASNAANMSIGATGAASLRLQLQRAAAARTVRYKTLRHVVLSSAQKQRLTLCSALLAEVAQGFGFRLTVRHPDGQEVGARQALDAVAKAQQTAATRASEGGASAGGNQDAAEAEGHAEDDIVAEPCDGLQGGGGDAAQQADGHGLSAEKDGVRADAAAADPLDALEPLEVDLDLDLEANGAMLQLLKQPQSVAGRRLASRLASSPPGSRPRPSGLNALLSGRLTSATLGSMGLIVKKRTAAAQALQTARRRALARAASNAAAEDIDAAAEAAGATTAEAAEAPAAANDAAAPSAAGGGLPATAAREAAGTAAGAATTGDASAGSSRLIVWDPEKLSKPSNPVPSLTPAGRQFETAAPPAKRLRTPAGGVSASVTPAASGGGGSERHDAGVAIDSGAAAGAVRDSAEREEVPQALRDDQTDQEGSAVGEDAGSDGRAGVESMLVDDGHAGGAADTGGGDDAPAAEAGKLPDPDVVDDGRGPGQDVGGRTAAGGAHGSGTRQRAPIHTGQAARSGDAGGSAVGEQAGGGAGGSERSGAGASRAAAAGRPASGLGGGRGAGALGSPAGKLFGAAVRQLQQRRNQG